MNEAKTLTDADIRQMTIDGNGEFTRREFKSGLLVDGYNDGNRDQITTAVSSFANSGGGTVVVGVGERKIGGGKDRREFFLCPVTTSARDKDWLDNVLGACIDPRIPGLRIDQIQAEAGGHYLVVTVPQGDTAHQASDLKYYRRYTTKAVAMRDYEVRDVMNRRKHPRLMVAIALSTRPGMAIAIRVRLTNVSPVMARFYRVIVEVPLHIRGRAYHTERGQMVRSSARQPSPEPVWKIRLTTNFHQPLFPGEERVHSEDLQLASHHTIEGKRFEGSSIRILRCQVFADEMPKLEFERSIEDCFEGWPPVDEPVSPRPDPQPEESESSCEE